MCHDCDWVLNPFILIHYECKLVYIVLPKCASSFITNNILDENDIVRQGYHRIRVSEFIKLPDYTDYFVWTCIRDPMTRFVSSFLEYKYNRSYNCKWDKIGGKNMSIDMYLDKLEMSHCSFEPHSMLQTKLIKNLPHVSFVGCIEKMDDAIKIVRKHHPSFALHKNVYSHIYSLPKPQLTSAQQQRVQQIYKQDFTYYRNVTMHCAPTVPNCNSGNSR